MKPNGPLRITHQKPIISISHHDLCAIQHIVKIAPKEAQWFHRINKLETTENNLQVFQLYEVYIPEQYCSGAEVESDPAMMVTFYKELKEKHGQKKTNAILTNMSVWCHSHHSMAVNPSGQDNKQFHEQCEQALKQNITTPQAMMIFNKKNEYYCRIYDPETGFEFENVDIIVNSYDFSQITKEAKRKFKERKVTKITSMPYQRRGQNDYIDWHKEWWKEENKERNLKTFGKHKKPTQGKANYEWYNQEKKKIETERSSQEETLLQDVSFNKEKLDPSIISNYNDLKLHLEIIESTNAVDSIQISTAQIIIMANQILNDNLVVLNILLNGSEDEIWALEDYSSESKRICGSSNDIMQAEIELFELVSDGVLSLEMLLEALDITLELQSAKTPEEAEILLDKWIIQYTNDVYEDILGQEPFEMPVSF